MNAPPWAAQAPRVHPHFHPQPHPYAIYPRPAARWHPAPPPRKMHPPPHHPSDKPIPLPHPSHDFPMGMSVDAFPAPGGEAEDELMGIEAFDPALYNTPPATAMEVVPMAYTQARGRSQSVASAREEESGSTTLTFFPNPSQPPIQLKNARKSGLLSAPPGSVLEVNQLLILRPPQANAHQSFDGHISKWEMYTCRVCSKTYDGKNARSVARRHLQDKHGVPLSVQARRSRWDYAEPKEKNTVELRENALKSKREWAVKHRQQSKIEKLHADFLEQFGPRGLATSNGVLLIAPRYRGSNGAVEAGDTPFIDGINGNIVIPEEILTAVTLLRANEKKLKNGTVEDAESSTTQPTRPLTPPHGPMSALTVSPKSPKRFPPPPQSTHHEIYQHQLDHLRRQHAAKPFAFADVPMTDKHASGGYAAPPPPPVMTGRTDMPVYQRPPDMGVMARAAEVSKDMPVRSEPQIPQPDNSPPEQQACLPQSIDPALEIEANQTERSQREASKDSMDNEAEVAAKNLLNLSTPIRAPEEDDAPAKVDFAPRPAPPAWKLLDAPSIGPPAKARPTRSKSSVKPFRDPRPEVTRSLSFEQTPSMDDDPFGFGEMPDRPISAAAGSSKSITSFRTSRKHVPSPSPLSSSTRKRKAPPSSPFAAPAPASISRPALRPLSTSFSNRGFTTLAATPIRSAVTPHVPYSLTKNWLMSSPSRNDDAAASLGLVPTHLAPATPGMMRGIIGVETPDHGALFERSEKMGKDKTAMGGVKGKENGEKVKRKKMVLNSPTR
ncbi:hypothetical protein IAR50_002473 [Cryptococcus sp. DSM 104548]